jgi:hypothetical protein
VLGVTAPAIAVAQSLFSVIIGSVAIAFLTYFMLLDGPRMVERFLRRSAESARPRWQRVGHEIYRTVGGYVTGNILISVIAGVAAMVALFAVGSSYSVALAVVVAILDLVPLAGATMAAVIVSTVVFRRARLGEGRDHHRLLPAVPAAREPRPSAHYLRPYGAALPAHRPDLGPDRAPSWRGFSARSPRSRLQASSRRSGGKSSAYRSEAAPAPP